MSKTYILKVERKNIGKEAGDYYNGEYGDSPEKIKELIEKGIIEEELSPEEYEEQELKDEIDLIVWDLETSGFVAPECKILEIGCFIVRGDVIERKHWVLNNGIEIPEKIVEITGITQEIIDKEGRDPKECLQEFLPLFKQAKKNVTHNGVRFDIPFLIAFSADLFGYTEQEKMAVTNLIRSTAFDTAVHFKAKKLDMQPYFRESFVQFADRVMNVRAKGVFFTLGLCVEELGITHELVQHRAMADVELTYEIYKKINQ